MNYANYIEGISFRLYKPQTGLRGFGALSNLLSRFGLSLEVLNTRLPADVESTGERLRGLLGIPRMSTYAIGAMINKGVALMPDDTCFVNVGVWHGFTLLAGMARNPGKRCVGVDNFSAFGGPRAQFLERFGAHKSPVHHFYEMDYQDYFSRVHSGPIGLYMYDGEHGYDNQIQGLRIAEQFFSAGCVLLIDDTNWEAPRRAVMDFIADSRHQYRVLLDKTTSSNCHPTLWNGIMVLQRVG